MNTALVVPTNRPEKFAAFAEAWDGFHAWDRVYIVQDGPEPTITRGPNWERTQVFSWRDLDEGPYPNLWSRRNSGVRCYGFWRAWKDGADVIFTLDDDCHPQARGPEDFVRNHLWNLYYMPVWHTTVHELHVRGLPYRNQGILRNVILSHGLWQGCPDRDAVQQLVIEGQDLEDPIWSQVLPQTQLHSICSMNLAFPGGATPLMFHAPMGEGTGYDRFDDIWMGILIQVIARARGLSIVSGQPLVRHVQEPNPFRRLIQEAAGIERNEDLWQKLANLYIPDDEDYPGLMDHIGQSMIQSKDPYLTCWGERLCMWGSLFRGGGS